jgi:peptidoglycan/LPS O-acetylase OafA/YrhL
LPIVILSVFYFKIQKGTLYLIVTLILIGFVFRIYNWNEYVQPLIDSGNRRGMVFGFQEKVYYPSYNRMDGLLIGVGIALINNYKPKLREFFKKYSNYILLIGVGLFLIAYKIFDNFISYKTAVFGFPIISIAYGLIVLAAINPTCILHKFKSRITLIIATLSYAIYLTHKLLFHLTKTIIKNDLEILNKWTFWICFAISGIVGLIIHIAIEQPSFRFRNKILRKEI